MKKAIAKDFGYDSPDDIPEEKRDLFNKAVDRHLRYEIKNGCQTIQYQITTLMTTNGQAPFVTLFMYLDEVPEGQTRDDLAMIIEEALNQRLQGVKNSNGIYVTPAFPKLIYVLDEDNIYPDSKYYYLTKLAAKCTARRMVPDYISAKKQKELKKGQVYPCMGCVTGTSLVTYHFRGNLYVESFEKLWNRVLNDAGYKFIDKTQQNREYDKYIDIEKNTLLIFDKEKGFVSVKRLIRNLSYHWVRVHIGDCRVITCTDDHPFVTKRGRVPAKDLLVNQDTTIITKNQYSEEPDTDTMTDTVSDTKMHYVLGETHGRINIATKDKRLRSRMEREFSVDMKDLVSEYNCVPYVIFVASRSAKIAFLAGFLDHDAKYEFKDKKINAVIETPTEELAMGLLLLIQSLGIFAKIRYTENFNYEVSFFLTKEIKEAYPSFNVDRLTSVDFKDKEIDFTPDEVSDEQLITKVEYFDQINYSYDVTTESDHFDVNGIYSHNCRSFLTPEPTILEEDGSMKFYGRFNQGVVTINLPDVGLSCGKDKDKFWEIFEERLELCHRALRLRHERLLGTKSDVAPILWQNGALARLKPGETIDKLLYGGYSTISLGYAGLYECVKAVTGKSHTDPEAKEFALSIMQKMNDKCAEWRKAENIAYSLYGTPIETTTYKFAKCLQRRFGIIKDITDHGYITNSYHVNVREEIDAFEKLAFEAPFQHLSPGGAVSYIEVPNMENNLDAVLEVMKFIYDNIIYAELNIKSDYCSVCGSTTEIEIVEDDHGKLIWRCPICKNTDQTKMSVARRTCGRLTPTNSLELEQFVKNSLKKMIEIQGMS